MKKLFVVLAILVVATPAFATILGSKHDFRGGNATQEVCVYCHTPHGASTAANYSPLWNRTVGSTTLTSVYTSTTLNVVEGNNVTNIDAPLCFSCHDGTAVNAIINTPNYNGASNATTVTGNLLVDAAMNNDHPINFNATALTDTGINAGVVGTAPYLLNAGMFQCSTCHDVHNAGFNALLVADNAGSALCLDCHNK